MGEVRVTFDLADVEERLDDIAAVDTVDGAGVWLPEDLFAMVRSAVSALLGHAAEVDLAAWGWDGLPTMPRLDGNLRFGPAVSFTRPRDAVLDRKGNVKVAASPIAARLTGPTGGLFATLDPAELHAIGLHIIDAAATLAAIKAAHDPQDHQQEEQPTP